MANHLNNDQQLDQAVKEALESYEVPFESSAWAEMENSLDAAPKTYHPFRRWSFSLNTIIAIALLAGGLLIFKFSTSGAGTPSNKEAAEQTAVKKTDVSAPAQKPAENKAPAQTAPGTSPQVNAPESTLPVASNPLKPSNTYTYSSSALKKKNNNTGKKDDATTNEQGDFDFMKAAEQNKTNAPAFGDQIDPVHGFIHSTSESEKMKRLAEGKLSFGDQVMQGMKTDTSSVMSSKYSSPDNADSSAGKKPEEKKKKQKQKKESKKDTTEASTEASSPTNTDELAEKTDSVKTKRNPKQQPKYKSERTIIDP
jgi:hypothetical protein